MRGWRYRVVSPYRWERSKAVAMWISLAITIGCFGGLEWEPTMGEPLFPAPEAGFFFLGITAFLVSRIGTTWNK